MTRTTSLLLSTALLFGLALASLSAAAEESSRPLFVKVHADWCGTCTRLEPTWSALQREFGDEAGFVVLDVTDRGRLERAQAEAERLGIVDFFAAHKARTGTIGILEADTRQPLVVLKGETDVARYREALDGARTDGAS